LLQRPEIYPDHRTKHYQIETLFLYDLTWKQKWLNWETGRSCMTFQSSSKNFMRSLLGNLFTPFTVCYIFVSSERRLRDTFFHKRHRPFFEKEKPMLSKDTIHHNNINKLLEKSELKNRSAATFLWPSLWHRLVPRSVPILNTNFSIRF